MTHRTDAPNGTAPPPPPIAWVPGVIISVSGAYIVYQVRVAALKNMAKRQIERSHAAIQKIQQQQQARRLEQQAPPSPRAQQDESKPQPYFMMRPAAQQ